MTHSIPRIGFGTFRRVDDVGYASALAALEVGYRHLDTAEMYGNEREVGKAIRDSGLKRADIFITTKVAAENLGPGQIMGHARASLDRLGVSQVDLYLIHWPSIGDRYDIHDYAAQLGDVKAKGLAAQIGVSNFTKRHVDAAVKVLGKAEIATNQVECHVLLQNRPIVDHCRALGIPVTAYCPVARGHLAEHAGLKAIAARHQATPEQVGLAFLLAEGHIVIPSSSRRENIKANFEAQGLKLPADDIAAIRKMDEGRRLVNGSWAPKWDV